MDKARIEALRALHKSANGGLGCADWFDGDDARFYEAAHRGLPELLDTIDTLTAELESLKADAERYRKLRRDPSMLLHLRNTEFDSAIDALPPEPQGVGGETLCAECSQPSGQTTGPYCVTCGRINNV